jgi:uncharacterized membrane protein YfcA
MWADLSPSIVLMVCLGGFVGGVASGAAGFAYGLIASTIWLHVIDPLHMAMLVVSGGMIVQSRLAWRIRLSIDGKRLAPFLIAGLAGVPIGVALVVKTEPGAVRFGLALFLTAYGLYGLLTPRLPRIERGGRTADAVAGFLGGVGGGLAGLSGVAPAIWTQLRGWPKDVVRGVLQPFIVAMHVATLILIGAVAFDLYAVVLFVAVAPAILLGGWVGWMIYGKLSERQFQQVFAGLMVVSGVLLML